MRKSGAYIICGMLIVLLFAGFLYFKDFFLFQDQKPNSVDPVPILSQDKDITGGEINHTEPENSSIELNTEKPVKHKSIDTQINGFIQKINILEINLSGKNVEVKPELSHDLIYGFEKLSDIANRNKAYAAVNGGFFREYGEPGGMVMIDGELYTKPTQFYPVLVLNDKSASIEEFTFEMWIVHKGKKIKVNDINAKSAYSAAVVYTPVYGTTNRADRENITLFIKNGIIEDVKMMEDEAGIKGYDMLLTFYPPFKFNMENIPFKKGERIEFQYSHYFDTKAHLYECGSRIVKKGENVAPKRDSWVGVLTNRDPRTAVGIKDSSVLVLITVDGRQPGYSTGFTAKELADFLIDYGVEDAVLLDGGASTTMFIDGKIINHPSNRGRERKLGGGIIVLYEAK